MDRLMIFIDAEYVIQSLRHLANQKRITLANIKWRELIDWIKGDRHLIRCYYYSALLVETQNPHTYQQQQDFLKQLKTDIDYLQIKMGKLVRQKGIWVQKGVDVKIAVDMVTKAFLDHYDIGAIVSGDSDFISLIDDIKEKHGKQIELYTFDRTDGQPDQDLLMAADQHLQITNELYDMLGGSFVTG